MATSSGSRGRSTVTRLRITECERCCDATAIKEQRDRVDARPLVIVSSMTERWPLMSGASVVDQLPQSAVVQACHLIYDSDGMQVQCDRYQSTMAEFVGLAVDEVADATEPPHTASKHYLQWRDLPFPCRDGESSCSEDQLSASADRHADDGPQALASLLRRPMGLPGRLRQVNAWIGTCRTSHLHFDGLDNLLVVAYGRKEVFLLSPWQLAACYPQLDPDKRWKSAASTLLHPRLHEDFPKLASAERLHAVLHPGDALWIPAGWWHEVLTPTFTVAFNFWVDVAPLVRLRPTLLFLNSDLYAREYSARVSSDDKGHSVAQPRTFKRSREEAR